VREVGDGFEKAFWIIGKLTKATIAVEAQHSTHGTAQMIVVDVLRFGPLADRAHTPLFRHELINVRRANSVSTLEVIVPRATVQTLTCLAAPRVVARLAIRMTPVATSTVPRKLIEWLPLAAIWAALHPRRIRPGCDNYRAEANRSTCT
jgi:hypothetical protein